ncbi:MAG: hypothetical protein IT365_18685 [Candidatus Hydrogenedentes bacterium]|nr:hypothetical protein [Candidatus Hydrogenedentota bacterium]
MSEDYGTKQRAGQSMRAKRRRAWLRWAGLLIMAVLAAQCVWTASWFRERIHNKMRAHGCYDNLRELGVDLLVWRAENDDRWPGLSSVPGEFMFDPNQTKKDGSTLMSCLSRPSILRCPSVPSTAPDDEFPGDANYIYLGPGLQTEQEALAFLDAYLQAARAGEPLPMPVYNAPVHPTERARVEQSMPVAFDRPQNHDHQYINVVLADSNVQCYTMGTRYPATNAFWEKLEAIEAELGKK